MTSPTHKLVPVVPTPRMWTAGGDIAAANPANGKNDIAVLVYRAMLAAAPESPAPQDSRAEFEAWREEIFNTPEPFDYPGDDMYGHWMWLAWQAARSGGAKGDAT